MEAAAASGGGSAASDRPHGDCVVARRTRSTFKKRQKELARQQKRTEKLARRMQRKQDRQDTTAVRTGDEDPEIASILPGPQPPDEGEP